jgi:LysR family transcriptional regulator, glycine cleavage system transcriptional activator
MRLPSTTALACFEAAARLQSFTRAAAELALTQAAVSRQIIGLEARLGVQLFERRPAGLQLTAAGRTWLEDVRPALRQIERATAQLSTLKGKGGRLNLSVASSLCNHWLIPRLPGFTRAHPEITLNIATRVGPADFSAGVLDASLEFGDGAASHGLGLRSWPVLALDVAPVASPTWVRAHSAVLGPGTPSAALIHHSTLPEAWPGWFAAACRQAPHGPVGPRHDLMSMALQAALAGMGVALLPAFMTTPALASGQLRALSRVFWRAVRAYHLVMPEAAAERPALRSLRDWLLAEAALGAGTAVNGSTNESHPRRGRARQPRARPPAP